MGSASCQEHHELVQDEKEELGPFLVHRDDLRKESKANMLRRGPIPEAYSINSFWAYSECFQGNRGHLVFANNKLFKVEKDDFDSRKNDIIRVSLRKGAKRSAREIPVNGVTLTKEAGEVLVLKSTTDTFKVKVNAQERTRFKTLFN